jgi:alkylation response protein AidB-like acyl-CoA dehydrogenase
VDFRLGDDEQALKDALRRFCDQRVPIERLRRLEESAGFDRALWRELAELGVFSLRRPEPDGAGLGMASAALVFAELGRRLVPGPIAWTHLGAGLAGAANGERIIGGCEALGPSRAPILVEHLASLDALLVIRREDVHLVDPKALAAEEREPLDPLTPIAEVASLPDGERIGDSEMATALRRDGALLAAAELLGIAEATLELAVDYAKAREQFGRPIGSFQALKHLMSDMLVRKELARAAVYAAAATADDAALGDPSRAVAAAKVVAGEAAMKNARTCIQVHGGMGYTWEAPPHYYLKRAWVLENRFGTVAEHARAIGERLSPG